MGQSRPGPIAENVPTGGACPICKAPSMRATRPFCSKRCADVDLARWLRGAYVIVDDADSDEDGDAPTEAPAKRGDQEDNP